MSLRWIPQVVALSSNSSARMSDDNRKSSGDTFLYFAFGSNLLTSRIHYQNPSAVAVGPARLDGYRLDFRLASKVGKLFN